jgi:hypothetical protein
MRTLWAGATYWPVWLGVLTGTFLVREVWALQTGHPRDTLSEWVWRVLKVGVNKPLSSWGAPHFLVFGCWLVLVTWLTWHFFFRRFA